MDSITDILSDANKDINTIKKYQKNTYLRNILEAAFLPEKKMLLPEGAPPYKSVGEISPQITKAAFWQVARKVEIFQRQNLKPIVREQRFIECLESISDEEGKVLLASKDQTLNNIYPNLTYENLKSVGYFN